MAFQNCPCESSENNVYALNSSLHYLRLSAETLTASTSGRTEQLADAFPEGPKLQRRSGALKQRLNVSINFILPVGIGISQHKLFELFSLSSLFCKMRIIEVPIS
jgi:hypothetical protein